MRGLAASVRQELLHCSMLDLYCARADSGTLLETHASYFAMKSSHSGTPIFSSPLLLADVLVLVLAVAAGEAAGAAGLLDAEGERFVDTSVLAHATNKSPKTTQSGTRIFFFI